MECEYNKTPRVMGGVSNGAVGSRESRRRRAGGGRLVVSKERMESVEMRSEEVQQALSMVRKGLAAAGASRNRRQRVSGRKWTLAVVLSARTPGRRLCAKSHLPRRQLTIIRRRTVQESCTRESDGQSSVSMLYSGRRVDL